MPSDTLTLPWGKENIALALPKNWNLLGFMQPSPGPAVQDDTLVVKNSLAAPIGSLRLSKMVKPGMKIALIIDDDSRPTPVSRVLPLVLEELKEGGVSPEQITIIPALGVHRPMTHEEVIRRTGLSYLKVEIPDCDDPKKMTYLGTTSRATPVWVNKTAAQSDLIISVGCIEPHIIASFGGGFKNLVPGIAGRTTIAHNHAINCRPATYNNVGQPIKDNPMRLDLEECGALFKPPVFMINTILNSSLEIAGVVCGSPVEAHRVGADLSASIYGVKIPKLADIVITDSSPMDQDLRQGVKALANTVRALKPGGVMICLVRAEEGLGVFGLANRKFPLGRAGLKFFAPLLLPLVPKLKLKGMGEEDRFFLYFALQALRHADILMYAPTISTTMHERIPFVLFKDSLESAMEFARQRFPGNADVLVFPNGGSTYPILP